jgi:hypothetical protein
VVIGGRVLILSLEVLFYCFRFLLCVYYPILAIVLMRLFSTVSDLDDSLYLSLVP